MHVLFLNSWYPNKNAPTLGNFVQKHAEAAAKYNQVSCLSLFPSPIPKFHIETSEKNGLFEVIVYFPEKQGKIPVWSVIRKLLRYKKAFRKGLQLIESKQGKIDICHLNVVFPLGYFAQELKKKSGIPYVVTEHSTAYHRAKEIMSAHQLKITEQVLNQASFLLPVSNDLGKAISPFAPTIPHERITNVVNREVFQISKDRGEHYIHISTLDEAQKNPTGILEVLASLKSKGVEIPFRFISDFPYDQLEESAKNLGLSDNVSFVGPLSTEEVASELRKAKALVLFSNYENFPCVIAEAFMSGVPVISTSVNGIPEFVNESNGILIEARDQAALENAFVDMQNKSFDPELLRIYAIENFSYEAIGKAFSKIYKQVLNNVG